MALSMIISYLVSPSLEQSNNSFRIAEYVFLLIMLLLTRETFTNK